MKSFIWSPTLHGDIFLASVLVFRITVSNNSSRLSSCGQPSSPWLMTTKIPDIEFLVFLNFNDGAGK